jgi:hypothetical protein
MYMKQIASLILLIVLSLTTFAQEPDWVNYEMRKMKYPASTFITGFSKDVNRNKDPETQFIEQLKIYARTELVEGVQTSILAITTSEVVESNKTFNEYFKKSSVSASNMNIVGLKFQTYYDPKEKTGYVMAFAKKDEVYANYQNLVNQKLTTIKQKLTTVANAGSDKQISLKALNETFPLFREIEEAQTLMYVLRSSATDEETKLNETSELKTQVETKSAQLRNSQTASIEDASLTLAFNVAEQIKSKGQTIRLLNFTYQDTKMGSTFARRLADMLEQNLIQQQITVVRNVVPGTDVSNQLLLTGTYWEEKDQIRIIALVKEMVNNTTMASSEATIPVGWFTTMNISYLPENFTEAYSKMKVFSKDEVQGGGLIVDLYTNKGDDNLIYTEGDILKIYVRANKECYIRVVDYMADGSQVLFVDNYYISSDKVNLVYELPYQFECSSPFGVETIQLSAQSVPFKKLNTRVEDGFEFVVDDLPVILANSRGFKKINDETLKAEKRLTVTTMGH